ATRRPGQCEAALAELSEEVLRRERLHQPRRRNDRMRQVQLRETSLDVVARVEMRDAGRRSGRGERRVDDVCDAGGGCRVDEGRAVTDRDVRILIGRMREEQDVASL